MYLKVAETPHVVIQRPRTAKPQGMGFVPVVVRGARGSTVLRIPVPPVIRMFPRGFGRLGASTAAYLQDPCACFYPVPGVSNAITNPNGVPQCDPATGLAPGCATDEPPCGGIAFGAPGYADCVQSQMSGPVAAMIERNSAAAGIDYSAANAYAPLLAAAQRAAAPPVAGTTAKVAKPVAVTVQPVTSPNTRHALNPGATPVPLPPVVMTTPGPAPAPAPGSSTSSSTSTGSTAPVPQDMTGGALSFLTNPVSLFGFSIPVWMIGVGAAGALYLASSGKGRR